MAKTVSGENKNLSNKNLSTLKDGFVHKKNKQKLKQTPTGKVALTNGSKALKQSAMKLLNKKNSAKSNKNESDSDEDINEGIVLKEQSLIEETDNTDSEVESNDSEEENNVPNILGTSLADDSDDDDEDYQEDEEEVQINKGVKMFKGLKSNDKSTDSMKDSSDNSKIEDSVIDDDDDEIETEDDDDEDDDEEEEEEEVEEEEEEEEDEESDDDDIDEEEEADDDDDEEESENEEEGDESTLGLKALLSNSIADDDDDDEDFVEPEENDEDDDISDEEENEEEGEGEGNSSTLENSQQNENNKETGDSSLAELKEDKKTIFVGNLPKNVTKKQLKKMFKKFGSIDTIRLRGIVSKSLNVPKKVAAITNDVHPALKSVYAYIKFDSEESAKAAVSMNGSLFQGNHLRVDTADKSEKKYDSKKSVFLGNLHFNIDEETVRKHFEDCGEIESVRVIKDNRTGIGKGIGYVNFKTEDAVALALELDGSKILNRDVRVKPNIDQYKQKYGKRKHSTDSEKSISVRNKDNSVRRITEKEQKSGIKQVSHQQTTTFQGQKADKKKKKGKSKLEKRKKHLAEKLTAKPKKPRT